jgi:hypothetical protein
MTKQDAGPRSLAVFLTKLPLFRGSPETEAE